MKLSIITINLNNAKGLEKTLKSIQTQTATDFELIVVDGDSSDNSKNVIKSYEEIIHHLIVEKDSGIYNAMNKGIKIAKGDYLLFLNSGDYLESNLTLSSVLPLLHTEDIIYGDMVIDNSGLLTYAKSKDTLEFEEMIRGTLWHPVSFIKRDLFDKYGLYNEQYKIISDYEFFLRTIFVEGVSTRHIHNYISVFNTDGIGSSEKHKLEHQIEKKHAQYQLFNPKIIESALNHAELKRSKANIVYQYVKTKPFLLNCFKFIYSIAKRIR